MEIHQQVIKILQQVMQVLQQVMEISLFHTQGSVSPSAATKTDIVFLDGGLPTGERVVPDLDATRARQGPPCEVIIACTTTTRLSFYGYQAMGGWGR